MANIKIGGRLESAATGNIVTGANAVYDDNLQENQEELNKKFYKDFYFLGNFNVSSGGEDAAYNIAATQGQDAPTFMYYTVTSNNRTALVFNHWLGTVGLSKKISQYLLLDGSILCRTLELINNRWTKPNWVRGIDGGLLRDSSISVSKIRSANIDDTPTQGSNNLVRSSGVFNAINVLAEAAADYFNGGSYNRNTHNIELKHDGVVKVQIDATDFIKDGMVSNVTVDSTHKTIIITFNTDAGKEDIEISVLDLFSNDSAAWKAAAVAGSGAWGSAGDTAVPTVAAVEEYTYSQSQANAKFVPVTAKTFTEAQKEQARRNIGAIGTGDRVPSSSVYDDLFGTTQDELNVEFDKSIRYTSQTLTDNQKAQARSNIGAIGTDDTIDASNISDEAYGGTQAEINEDFNASITHIFYDFGQRTDRDAVENEAYIRAIAEGKDAPIFMGYTINADNDNKIGLILNHYISDTLIVQHLLWNGDIMHRSITRDNATADWIKGDWVDGIDDITDGVVIYDINVNELAGSSISSDTMTKLNKLRADSYEGKMLAIKDGYTDIPFTVKTYGSTFEGYFIANVNSTLSLVTVTAGTLTPATDWASTVIPLEKASNKVTSWQSTPDDTHYPSEKLVKNSIDEVDKFVEVEYGVATFAQVKALVDAGKIPYFYKDASDANLIKFEYSAYVVHSNPSLHSLRFAAPAVVNVSSNVHNYKVFLSYDNTWSGIADNPPEIVYNRKNTIVGNESRNDYYPSIKAVVDYVSNAKTEVEYSIDGKYKLLTPVENSEGHFAITPLGVNYITESVNTAIIVIDEGNSETPYGSVYDPDMGWLYTVIFKTGSTPNITFEFSQVSTDKTIVYPDDFSIEANRLYELSIMYVGYDVISNVRTYLLRIVDYTIPEITNGGSND